MFSDLGRPERERKRERERERERGRERERDRERERGCCTTGPMVRPQGGIWDRSPVDHNVHGALTCNVS